MIQLVTVLWLLAFDVTTWRRLFWMDRVMITVIIAGSLLAMVLYLVVLVEQIRAWQYQQGGTPVTLGIGRWIRKMIGGEL